MPGTVMTAVPTAECSLLKAQWQVAQRCCQLNAEMLSMVKVLKAQHSPVRLVLPPEPQGPHGQ